jgi:hypothetical protein
MKATLKKKFSDDNKAMTVTIAIFIQKVKLNIVLYFDSVNKTKYDLLSHLIDQCYIYRTIHIYSLVFILVKIKTQSTVQIILVWFLTGHI